MPGPKRNQLSGKMRMTRLHAIVALRLARPGPQSRMISRPVLCRRLTTNATNSAVTSTTPNSAEMSATKESGGIPWGLIIPLGLITSVIAYFYRGNKNAKLEAAFKNELKDGQFMSHEELVQVRETNKLPLKVFQELSTRARQQFGANEVDLKLFLDEYCVDQLGGDFQARGGLKSKHIFDRLEKALGNKADLSTSLCALSLAVLDDPSDLIKALYSVLKDDEQMTYERFVRVVDILDKTNQLPVRVLVKQEKAYPFNKFLRATPPDVAEKSLLALNPNGAKDKEPEKFVQERKKKSLSEEDFLNLLLSTDLCVWGACWHKRPTGT